MCRWLKIQNVIFFGSAEVLRNQWVNRHSRVTKEGVQLSKETEHSFFVDFGNGDLLGYQLVSRHSRVIKC